VGSRLFVSGGGTGRWVPREGVDLTDCFVLDLVTMRWSAVPSPPSGLGLDTRCLGRNHKATLAGETIVFMGGSRLDTNSILLLDTKTLQWRR
jgi:hypothetical protein